QIFIRKNLSKEEFTERLQAIDETLPEMVQ
ncbi:hypothetical protein, partial [Listeria monocytogenes]